MYDRSYQRLGRAESEVSDPILAPGNTFPAGSPHVSSPAWCLDQLSTSQRTLVRRGNVKHELTRLWMIRGDRISRSMEVEQLDHSPGSVEQTSPGQYTGSKPQRYQCPDCDKSYRAKETLNRHRKNHSRHVDHVCHVCHVGFRRKDLLLRHYKIHRGDETTSGHLKDRQRSRQACDRCSKLKTKVGAM